MEITEIYNRLKKIDALIDPTEVNLISAHISGFLQDYEEAIHEQNLIVSNKWLIIREGVETDTKATRLLEVSSEYQEMKRLKMRIDQLKRMKSDLRSRFSVLTFNKF